MELAALIVSSLLVHYSALGSLGPPTCRDDRRTIVSVNNLRLSESESTSYLEATLLLNAISTDFDTVAF